MDNELSLSNDLKSNNIDIDLKHKVDDSLTIDISAATKGGASLGLEEKLSDTATLSAEVNSNGSKSAELQIKF